MALRVDVSGFGICRTDSPYPVYIVCVQQEKFEAWVVYRRFINFLQLQEHIKSLQPNLPLIPTMEADSLNMEKLESCRVTLDRWLRQLAGNTEILRMQSMYQFLCIDANMPPPYLEVHWKNPTDGSFEEMHMDEMFDEDMDEGEEADDEDWDEDEDDLANRGAVETVFKATQMSNQSKAKQSNSASSNAQGKQRRPQQQPYQQPQRGSNSSSNNANSNMDGADDGMDIQSLSYVEAEFIYDKKDEGKADTADKSEGRKINLEAFKIIKVIGKGSFGKVFLVRDKASGMLYAMKVLKKEYIIQKNQVEHTKTERSVLGYVHHPFIVGLNMAFQTADKLFFVLDYCSGGELFFHLGQVGRFPEERAKFYAAQIILALEYVHKRDVVYRDLKPENVLLDQRGNVRLTDFGLSKEGVSHHSPGANSFCGTPEYIAPEVLLKQGHGRAVDWWSLGALLYEMLAGLPPFYSRNREIMFEKIMKADLSFPPHVSEKAKDLLSHLLVRDPKQRLGSGDQDAEELKCHPFFRDVAWTDLYDGKVQPPWTPTFVGSLDTSQFDQEFTSMMPIGKRALDSSKYHLYMYIHSVHVCIYPVC